MFEINLRQGRSNYYVTASGMNIARLVVEKWNDGGSDCVLNSNEVFWHHVPARLPLPTPRTRPWWSTPAS